MNELVVPMQVQALVVSTQNAAFRTWPFNYSALWAYNSPEPVAGGGQSTFLPRPMGVYLHWDLPDALRHGTSDVQGGPVTYPPVPNRWLVVRRSGANRAATSWVVESDCPNQDSITQYLVDDTILAAWTASGQTDRVHGAQSVRTAAQNGILIAELGKAFGLAGWSERAADATFLTAVAPGNVLFSAYETHCANVFTFYDALDGVAPQDLLSYLVVGWYSKAADDVLAAHSADSLGWSGVPKGDTPTTSIYEGIVNHVPWHNGQEPPTPVTALAGKVHVGIGETTTDAFTALIASQLSDPSSIDLLKAFQYGLLPVLEDVNGSELLRLAGHQATFSAKPGSVSWEIAPAEGAAAEPLTTAEAAWLAALNVAQADLDNAVETLASYRAALYGLWWKMRKGEDAVFPPHGFNDAAYQTAVKTTLPALVAATESAVQAKVTAVPRPDVQSGDTRQDSYLRGVTNFAAAKGLAKTKVLKPVAGPRLWQAADPVVVLSGVEPATLPDPKATLPCRLDTDIITSLKVGTATLDATTLAAVLGTLPAATGMPQIASALVVEAFLLDASNATVAANAVHADPGAVTAAMTNHPAGAYTGTVPANDLSTWTQQPWSALLMEWQLNYVAIPPETSNTPNWQFNGNDYLFTGPYGFASDSDAPLQQIGSIVPLTPEAQFTFGGRLKQFVDAYVTGHPDAPLEVEAVAHLYEAIESLDSWRYMSQSLTGFGGAIAQRDTRAHVAPDASVAAQVAGVTEWLPVSADPTPTFDALRRGQFAMQQLIVYDTFGQVLQVVGGTGTTDPQNFAPQLDAGLRPDKPVITRNPARLVEMRPRLMQHARLDFELADARTNIPVLPGSNANPVIGWMLPNHLDAGVLLYGPTGSALGEVSLVVDGGGHRTSTWRPPPHSTMTFSDVVAAAPILANIVGDPAFKQEASFLAFLDTIDATLWSIDPIGNRADQNMSVLIGRPLAIVRAALRLTLDGHPITDVASWTSVWPPPTPAFLTQEVPVRLGDLASRQDGLLGLWRNATYNSFDSVAAPDAPQAYLHEIGPVGQPAGQNYPKLTFGDTSPTYVNLLVDPRAAVHAITGILPVTTLTVPGTFVDPVLRSLELSFRIGSVLTHTEGEPPAIWLPAPAEQNGTWTWWEPGKTQWTSNDLLRASADARLKDYPNTVRDGFLQLVAKLDEKETP